MRATVLVGPIRDVRGVRGQGRAQWLCDPADPASCRAREPSQRADRQTERVGRQGRPSGWADRADRAGRADRPDANASDAARPKSNTFDAARRRTRPVSRAEDSRTRRPRDRARQNGGGPVPTASGGRLPPTPVREGWTWPRRSSTYRHRRQRGSGPGTCQRTTVGHGRSAPGHAPVAVWPDVAGRARVTVSNGARTCRAPAASSSVSTPRSTSRADAPRSPWFGPGDEAGTGTVTPAFDRAGAVAPRADGPGSVALVVDRVRSAGRTTACSRSRGHVVRTRPVGSVHTARASGCSRTVQPGRCLMRWCRRHRQMRFAGPVGPVGQGRTWSRSQNLAATEHPGNRHRPSRARTSAPRRRPGRYAEPLLPSSPEPSPLPSSAPVAG